MKLAELVSILDRYGFALKGYQRFKRGDRLTIQLPSGTIIQLDLRVPLERADKFVLMRWILGRDLYKKFLEEEGFKWM